MAELGIAGGRCAVYKGRKFPGNVERLREVLSDEEKTFLLYPGSDSSPLEDVVAQSRGGGKQGAPLTFIVLDGTWDVVFHQTLSIHIWFGRIPNSAENEYSEKYQIFVKSNAKYLDKMLNIFT